MANLSDQTSNVPLQVGILWRYAAESPLYRPWLEAGNDELQFIILDDYHLDTELPELDILVTHMHYRWDELAILRKTFQASRTAVLVIADGILEYRNTWENPNIPPGSILRPAFAHKIATLGNAQARILETWGNQGKCEVVGFPRLDPLAKSQGWWEQAEQAEQVVGKSSPVADSEFPLLICSATTPAFDESQWRVVYQEFQDLRAAIDLWNQKSETKLSPHWRVSKEISVALEMDEPDTSLSLHDAILKSAAVITTPSTIQLESMLCRKPTVLLDYFSTPRYVPSAWPISNSSQFEGVFRSLLAGCPARDSFQNLLLRDQLRIHGSATQRMLELIQSMAKTARRARIENQPLRFPAAILPEVRSDLTPACEVKELIDASHAQELHGLSQKWSSLQSSVDNWMAATEIQAAVHRASEAASDRAQLCQIDKAMSEMQANYEAILAEKLAHLEEKRLQISEQNKLLEAAAQRHQALNELLNSRNEEFARVQNRVKELATAREADHKLLAEAYSDAKAKQQRVTELRERNQVLLSRIEELKNPATMLQEENQPSLERQKNLAEANRKLAETHQSLVARIDELVEERKRLYERLKEANSPK